MIDMIETKRESKARQYVVLLLIRVEEFILGESRPQVVNDAARFENSFCARPARLEKIQAGLTAAAAH